MLFRMSRMTFTVTKTVRGKRARTGELTTPHGVIHTPAFAIVGTKGTVKALTMEQVHSLSAEVLLGNTYHLYLEPGDEIVRDAGGLHSFMGWNGPLITDSGGFQVFSLGEAFEKGVSKIAHEIPPDEGLMVYDKKLSLAQARLARIDEEGVTFTSHRDGTTHRFTAERSIEIQHNLGADIIFTFDECTSPAAPYEYQKEASDRTHRWAKRSITAHRQNLAAAKKQAIFGVVQGGRFSDLRKESALFLRDLDFDGYGIGGSFTKHDLDAALAVVNDILPPEKPRHLLGIGEPGDIFRGIEEGIDLFDCVSPTRIARNGSLYTNRGVINILNHSYIRDFSPINETCVCYTCTHATKAYMAHLFRSQEMLGATLASIHNLHFILSLFREARNALLTDTFLSFKDGFMRTYTKT